MRLPLLCLLLVVAFSCARAEEPFFKKNDVIALVGGEDMVVAGEDGYLELLLVRALPDYHLRVRSLAWEGDTVFEQRRDLNFPTWEEALDKIGATVVICQFGQMESLAGKEKIPEFTAAYKKLLERFSGGGKRRVVIIAPTFAEPTPRFGLTKATLNSTLVQSLTRRNDCLPDYLAACSQLAEEKCAAPLLGVGFSLPEGAHNVFTRDGIHLTEYSQLLWALSLADDLKIPQGKLGQLEGDPGIISLRDLIIAKNQLWFDYWRVQNWAFLAGDRTSQPSSRDWKDPSKRWFPAEREEFIPLIEAKEKEIDALAEKLK